MRPSFSACACRILKISSCFRRPLVFWTLRSRASAFRSGMLFSFNSERFIPLVGPPGVAVAVSAFWGGWLDWPRSRRALIQRLRVRDGWASLLGLGGYGFSLRVYCGVGA